MKTRRTNIAKSPVFHTFGQLTDYFKKNPLPTPIYIFVCRRRGFVGACPEVVEKYAELTKDQERRFILLEFSDALGLNTSIAKQAADHIKDGADVIVGVEFILVAEVVREYLKKTPEMLTRLHVVEYL